MNKKDICSYNYDELKEEMLAIGEKHSGANKSMNGFM